MYSFFKFINVYSRDKGSFEFTENKLVFINSKEEQDAKKASRKLRKLKHNIIYTDYHIDRIPYR